LAARSRQAMMARAGKEEGDAKTPDGIDIEQVYAFDVVAQVAEALGA
jgi:hypothetical protein